MNKEQLTEEFIRQGHMVDAKYLPFAHSGIEMQVNRLYEHLQLTNWAMGQLLSMLPDDAISKEDEDAC